MFTEGWDKSWHIVDGDELLAKELMPVFKKHRMSKNMTYTEALLLILLITTC